MMNMPHKTLTPPGGPDPWYNRGGPVFSNGCTPIMGGKYLIDIYQSVGAFCFDINYNFNQS